MYKEKIFTIIFIKLIINIENNEVIEPCGKLKENWIISFWVIVYESYKNMVLRKMRLKFQKGKTQWSSWLIG